MKVIVTGAAGFIGSAVCSRLLSEGHDVVGVDLLDDRLYPRSEKENRLRDLNREAKFTFVKSSSGGDAVDEYLDTADVIINEAAMPGLRLSWLDFEAYANENCVALVGLLNKMVEHPHLHLVHASTSSVYGADAIGSESQATNPVSPYGVTKLAAEHLIQGFRTEFGLSASILRYFSVYGPRQRPDMAYAQFCSALLQGREIFITGDGTQTRSNTFIEDIVDATCKAAFAQSDGLVANVCGSESISILEALTVLAGEMELEPNYRFIPRPEGDQQHTLGDASLAERLLSWIPRVPIREGLQMQARQFLIDHSNGRDRKS